MLTLKQKLFISSILAVMALLAGIAVGYKHSFVKADNDQLQLELPQLQLVYTVYFKDSCHEYIAETYDNQ